MRARGIRLHVGGTLRGIQLAAAGCLTVLIALVLAGTAPSLLGYESFVVYSGSMEPRLGVGDLAVVAMVKSADMKEGDVITYRPAEQPSLLVTHRLVRISLDDRGRLQFTTKGDANNFEDQVVVRPEAVLGRVAYSLPKLGYLVDFSQRPTGKVLLVGIPGLLLGLDYLLAAQRRRSAVQPAKSQSEELLNRARIALNNGAGQAALTLCDQAIAADPRLVDAWLFKADCLEPDEGLACLRAGLTVNPRSIALQHAIERVHGSVRIQR